MNSRERIAYLRGLLDFMPREEKEAKIYSAIVDALDALAQDLEGHTTLLELQREDYGNLADELDELREAVYELEESMDLETYDDDQDDGYGEKELEELTESYISITCPSCTYSFYCRCDEGGGEAKRFVCPACGEEFTRSE